MADLVGEDLGVSVFDHRVEELGFTESGYSVVVLGRREDLVVA